MGHLLKYHFVNLQEQIGGNLGNQESDAKNSLKHKMYIWDGKEVDQISGQITMLLYTSYISIYIYI